MSRVPDPPRVFVVGHDGSAAAAGVVAWAAPVARAAGDVRVDLVHAVTLPTIPVHHAEISVAELLDRHEAEARSIVEAARRDLAAAGVPAEVAIRRWLPAETLLEHTAVVSAELLVVGQHSSRAERVLLGSTSAEVARDAEVPVVVVRGGESASPPRRVLLAADGSPASLRAAACVARLFPTAAVLAIHVKDQDSEPHRDRLGTDLIEAGIGEERLEVRRVPGALAKTLLEIAASDTIDVVAAGRRGLSGWSARVLGSTSEKLLQLAPCPVLVAH